MRISSMGAVLAACLLGPASVAAAADAAPDMQPFRALVGHWTCAGSFASTGKPLAARIVIEWDEPTRSILYRHDDLPPNGFHAFELWGSAKGGGYRASIADAYSGIRWLTSPGSEGGAVEWTRTDGGVPIEKFRYSDASPAGFRFEWFVFGKDGQPRLGDSLQCKPES
jgi:hypothetical protein